MAGSVKAKKARLLEILQDFDRLAVAFSGGADSSLLLALAREAIGDRVVAFTAASPIHPRQEIAAARDLAVELGVRHRTIESREMELDDFLANPPERCYHCKREMFSQLLDEAGKLGITVLAHGANCDDLADVRPGFAAARELGAVAPLMDAGLTKADVRAMAREMGLVVWDKPAMACLASRIPYHTPITTRALVMVEEAENVLKRHGFAAVRVRHHGEVARIEVPAEDLSRLMVPEIRGSIARALGEIGFVHISADLRGYRQGSMNVKK